MAGTDPETVKHRREEGLSDDVDYAIIGSEMQFVEIELDPGESAISEAGAMMYKDRNIKMNAILGDGSKQGMFGKLLGIGKKLLTDESLFTTIFTNEGDDPASVAFASPYPGNIMPVKLDSVGGSLICQKDAFLGAARGVSIGIWFQKRILTALFGGEGFIMQKLTGDGWVFVHVGGTLVERDLAPGEVLHVDTGCLAAMTSDVSMSIETVGGIKSMIFGKEGVFFARLEGPGKVWMQSLPFSRLAGRIWAAAPQSDGED